METDTTTVPENKDAQQTLESYLMNRELVDFDVLTSMLIDGKEPIGKAEITLNDELLTSVATVWETHKKAIHAVVSARLKQLVMRVAMKDIPQEVLVTRQAILELIGVLKDFDTLYSEQVARNQLKETAQTNPAVSPSNKA